MTIVLIVNYVMDMEFVSIKLDHISVNDIGLLITIVKHIILYQSKPMSKWWPMCENTNKGFQCSCISGYYGSVCQYRESCYVNPCQNSGTCVDQIDGFKCICSNSYTGLLCDQRKHAIYQSLNMHIHFVKLCWKNSM